MAASTKTLRTCEQGHQYYKSSDCPTCPACAHAGKPENGFLSTLSSPARRALEHIGVTTVQQLAAYSEKEIMKLHGMGPASLPRLKAALEENGLTFTTS
ncbi:RNA polymerase alpha subunit C-terminal domain-containing protein [Paenibacillus silvisoli]|uniref:RNA polymerase alpha subunit C-terminal domain-containing protein n=1 Tax=Paenibacillus silvisoli TaxID=3110539 RepID=UPI002805F2E6|nr:RNA polymerase alpha subunit C-terminal domain-containing protein [Paenibacillus silvisoli]